MHATIGRASFGVDKLEANQPEGADRWMRPRCRRPSRLPPKGQYLKKIAVSSTMGPGVRIDQASLACPLVFSEVRLPGFGL